MKNEPFFYNLRLYYKWACVAAAQTQGKRRQKRLSTLKVKPMLSQVKTWDKLNLLSSTAPSLSSRSCVLSQGPTAPLLSAAYHGWCGMACACKWSCRKFHLSYVCYTFEEQLLSFPEIEGWLHTCFILGFYTYIYVYVVNSLHSGGCVLIYTHRHTHTHTKDGLKVTGAGFFGKPLCHAVYTKCRCVQLSTKLLQRRTEAPLLQNADLW